MDGIPPNHDRFASSLVDHVDDMIAYWDRNLLCRFANSAYFQWFGKSPGEIVDKVKMPDLLGPLFDRNLPYITGVLNGERQTFEIEGQTASGETWFSRADYYPDIVDDVVKGFFVHIADMTHIKKLARERENLIESLQRALSEIKTLTGLLPICAWCKKIRDDKGYWNQIESYISAHSSASFTHGICDGCTAGFKSKDPFDWKDGGTQPGQPPKKIG